MVYSKIKFNIFLNTVEVFMENKTNITQRIVEIKTKLCNNNNKNFAQKLNCTEQYASNICNGQKSTGKKLLEKILAAFPDVSRSWLYFGEGNMMKSDGNEYAFHQNENVRIVAESNDETLKRENKMLYEHIDLLKEEIARLKAELALEKAKNAEHYGYVEIINR